jgi:1-phosphofructokinase family hexose kinase
MIVKDKDPGSMSFYDVVVVSPNSALDSYYVLPNLSVGSVNRAQRSIHTAGGKGNNVSRAIKALGGQSLSLGILGGHAGKFVAEELDREKISYDVVWSDRETRRSSTIVVPQCTQTTVALDSGLPVSLEDGNKLIDMVCSLKCQAPFLVLTGSLPPGLNADYYAELIQRLGYPGSPAVCIDCSGEVLKLTSQAGPAIIKVNVDEFQATFAKDKEWNWKYANDIFSRLQEYGVELLIITAGPLGAYVFHRDTSPYNVITQSHRIVTTAGAGDAFLAGLLVSLSRGGTLKQSTCFGSAAAAANLMQIVCGALNLVDVEEFLSHTSITPLI